MNFIPLAQKLALVEFILVETILVYSENQFSGSGINQDMIHTKRDILLFEYFILKLNHYCLKIYLYQWLVN